MVAKYICVTYWGDHYYSIINQPIYDDVKEDAQSDTAEPIYHVLPHGHRHDAEVLVDDVKEQAALNK